MMRNVGTYILIWEPIFHLRNKNYSHAMPALNNVSEFSSAVQRDMIFQFKFPLCANFF